MLGSSSPDGRMLVLSWMRIRDGHENRVNVLRVQFAHLAGTVPPVAQGESKVDHAVTPAPGQSLNNSPFIYSRGTWLPPRHEDISSHNLKDPFKVSSH
jgi:hypothetical protein